MPTSWWRGSRLPAAPLPSRRPGPPRARPASERALSGRTAVTVEVLDDATSAALQLGQPPVGALQLLFAPGHEPTQEDLSTLATFGVRAAHALRASIRSRTVAQELE